MGQETLTTTDEIGPAERGKGSASPPRMRWKEMAGELCTFENAQYPVDTADIYGTFSFVGTYRKMWGPPLSLRPQLEVVRRTVF